MVLLDGDILVRRNMDELMEVELDSRVALEEEGDGSRKRVFAAAHACACNPMKKEHYPANWYVFFPPYLFLVLPVIHRPRHDHARCQT